MNLETIVILFAASMVELWMAIPLGFVMELNPLLIAIISAAGAILSGVFVTILGDNLRNRFLKWKYEDE